MQNVGKIVEKELSYKITGILFKIHKSLGMYAKERQHGDALENELKSAGIDYEREKPISVAGRKSNFADFIIDKKVAMELKAKPFISKEDYYQIQRYLSSACLELGLLVNFRQAYLKPKRVLNSELYSGH